MRKRNIKTKQQKYKGSITIFAALSFMLIAQFIFTMLEVSRTIEVRKTLQMNTESVLESIFANYCSPLWEEYRLLGTSVVNSDGGLRIFALSYIHSLQTYKDGESKTARSSGCKFHDHQPLSLFWIILIIPNLL